MKKISVIIPIFNEEGNVEKLHKELTDVLTSIKLDYELIFVNDGSTDRSLEILKNTAREDGFLKIISFSRNFGQTAALVAGMDAASGEVVVFMDGDLQNDPKDIPLLTGKIEEGYDVVSGWRKKRKDKFLSRRLPSIIANKLISLISGVHLHDYGCTLKAYRLQVLKDIKLYGEMHRFIPIYASWVGARIAEIPTNHRPRIHGKTKYSINRTFKVLLDLITIKFLSNYGTKPIYIFGGSGLISIALSFVCLTALIANKVIRGASMIQSPLLLLTALLIIIGFQSILMGILAEMQIRTYFESLHKPIYHIREKINL
ncbi:MAG: glycosyltransferase family 2 protein [Candidatus Omnitrophota bacterium]